MSLKDRSTLDLICRQKVLEMIIEESAGDLRVEEPRRQLNLINAELESRKDNVKPQNKKDEDGNLTVGLKSVKLTGSSKLG